MDYKKWQFLVIPNKDIMKGKSPQLQTVYMWICSFADDEWQCFPSIKTIADCAWCSKDTVIRKLVELEELWILLRQRRFNNNEKTSNLYQIRILDKLGSSTQQPPSSTQQLGGSSTQQHRTKSTLLTKTKEGIPSFSFLSQEIKDRFEIFVQIRIEKEKGISINSIELLYKRLNKLSDNPNKQLEIINKSIECNRKSFFPIKHENDDKKFTVQELIKIAEWLIKAREEWWMEAVKEYKEKRWAELCKKAVAEYNKN